MPDSQPVIQGRNWYKPVLLVVCLIVLIGVLYAVKRIALPVSLSFVLYFILKPVVNTLTDRKISSRITISKLWATVIAFVIATFVLSLFLGILVPPIVEQIIKITNNMPQYAENWKQFIKQAETTYIRLNLPDFVDTSLQRGVESIAGTFSGLLKSVFEKSGEFISSIVLLFFIPFLTFYLFLEKDHTKITIASLFPKHLQNEVISIINESSEVLSGYIKGQLILSAIMGVFIWLGLTLLGVKAALLLGLIAGITKAIPIVGIFIAGIPATFIALTDSPMIALWVVILFTAIQLIENKAILPNMLARYVKLSPLSILFALMAGEEIGGIWGMLLATPAAAILKIVYSHIRERYE
ncbi:MAG: AI-2E family transporter [bacterium]